MFVKTIQGDTTNLYECQHYKSYKENDDFVLEFWDYKMDKHWGLRITPEETKEHKVSIFVMNDDGQTIDQLFMSR